MKHERVFSFDIGWAFHGWAVKQPNNNIDTGVYAFEHSDANGEFAKIRRDKNRKKSKKDRLNKLKELIVETGIVPSRKELDSMLKKSSHQNRLWQNLIKAHRERIDPEEFMQIIYRFAKRRHYVDMKKKKNFKQNSAETEEQKKAKAEEGRIRKSLSKIEKLYSETDLRNGEVKTWFSALFERREELIDIFKKHAISIDRSKFPYTNSKVNRPTAKDDWASCFIVS